MLVFSSQAREFPEASEPTVTIEVWSSFHGDLLQTAAQHFEQETGHKLAIRQFSSTFDIRSELLIAKMFGTYVPDMVWVPSDFLGLHEYIGLAALPVEWVDKSSFEPKSLESLMIDEQVYGLPLSLGNHLMLYYDKRRVSEPLLTWEQFISLEQALDQAPPNAVVAMGVEDAYFFSSFFSLFYDSSPMVSFEFNQDATAQTIHFVQSLLQSGVLADNCAHQCGRDRLVSGEVDYLIDGDWALSLFPEEYIEQHLAIAPLLPTWQGKAMQSFSGGKVVALTEMAMADQDKKAALQRFIELIQQPAFLSRLQQETYHVSANSSFNQNHLNRTELEHALYQQYLSAQPMPVDPRLSIAWESLARTLQRINEGMPVDEAATFFETFFVKYQQRL
ncbi:sugar ABC transporter substrate-binding protein [Vibrio astriarenae]